MKTLCFLIPLFFRFGLFASGTRPAFTGQMIPDAGGKTLQISMQLNLDSFRVSGYYHYGSSRAVIRVAGMMQGDSTMQLFEYSGQVKTNHCFSGQWKNGRFGGAWTGNGKKYRFDLSQVSPVDFVETYTVQFDTTLLYRKGSKRFSKIELRFSESSIYVKGPAGMKAVDSINTIFWSSADSVHKDFLWPKQRIVRNFQVLRSDFESAYATDIAADTTDPDYKDDSFGSPEWYSESEISCLFNDYGVFSYSSSGSAYTGGAHGYGGESFHTIDLYSGKKMTLSALFVDGFESRLNVIAEKYFRTEAGDASGKKTLSDLGHPGDVFAFPDEFAVTASGIEVNIEDGIYMSPSVSFLVPYSALQSIIRPNGPLSWALQ